MPRAATDGRTNPRSGGKPQLYAPSWVDRFNAWVEPLPGPTWSYYLGIGLLLLLVEFGVPWAERVRPTGTFLSVHGFLAGLIAFFLASLHYVDRAADAALATLRPALKADEQEYGGLRYQLTTLPARPTLLASLAGLLFIVVVNELLGTPSSFDELAAAPISAALIYFMYALAWWVAGAFMYHTVHQLRVINRIYTRHTCINLFRMGPLYAFSGVTALTAVSLTVPTYGWLAINPGLLYDPIALGVALPITVLALATFVWPLLGIHRLLVEEKRRLLDEASLRLETTIVELHQRVDSGRLEGMDDMNKAIASLEIEQNALNGIPTWPWQAETVRWLITALVLPLVLWIIQLVLQRILGA